MESSFSRVAVALPTVDGAHIPEPTDIKEAVGRAVDEKSQIPVDFVCFICKCLVYDPYSCNKCESILCKICIDNRRKSGYQGCASCKESY